MSATVKSILDAGNQSIVVDVECHISNGLPAIVIVGFANKAIEESKERIRGAFANTKLDLPRKRITINLAPADIPKDSTSFDLPIAVAILVAGGQVSRAIPTDVTFIGELGLDGSVRGVRGIIGKLLAGRKKGFKTFYISQANQKQAELVPGINIIPVSDMRSLYLDLTNTTRLTKINTGNIKVKTSSLPYPNDFSEIVGQARAKRALEIAAAGMHNILLNGAPGTGKSMLAKALPSILPPMNIEEILEVTHLHSLAGKDFEKIIMGRPFRAPHHSASEISIVGGGQHPKPGEISLAHHGVLFFDEFPEFSRQTIEALRQPLEDRVITVARARDNITFPAHFMLVATSNPCPCGYYGTSKPCVCLPYQINKYQQKISGPIIDRIDLHVDVDEIEHSTLLRGQREESSKAVRKRIMAARTRQYRRYNTATKHNASLTNRDIKTHLHIETEAEALLNQAAQKLGISPRSYMRIIKVAQTIADLAGKDRIGIAEISEALQYRRQVVSF